MIREKSAAEKLVSSLQTRQLKIATAESCTGGLVSKMITDVSGSSEVFDCGICSYANCIKTKLLGVKESTLSAYGAVSAQTACEMARGALAISGADIAVSTTGIAGPTGGSCKKPVGLVYFSVATKNTILVTKHNFNTDNSKNRSTIRYNAAEFALKLVRKWLREA